MDTIRQRLLELGFEIKNGDAFVMEGVASICITGREIKMQENKEQVSEVLKCRIAVARDCVNNYLNELEELISDRLGVK